MTDHEVEMLAQAFKAIVQEQAIEQQAALAALRAELRFEVGEVCRLPRGRRREPGAADEKHRRPVARHAAGRSGSRSRASHIATRH